MQFFGRGEEDVEEEQKESAEVHGELASGDEMFRVFSHSMRDESTDALTTMASEVGRAEAVAVTMATAFDSSSASAGTDLVDSVSVSVADDDLYSILSSQTAIEKRTRATMSINCRQTVY